MDRSKRAKHDRLASDTHTPGAPQAAKPGARQAPKKPARDTATSGQVDDLKPEQSIHARSIPEEFFVLVERDELYYRILQQPTLLVLEHQPVKRGEPLFELVDRVFRPVFRQVWESLPPQVRKRVLRHWRKKQNYLFFPTPTVYCIPSINVYDVRPWSDVAVLTNGACELNFPLETVLDHPDTLPDVIATVLAMVWFRTTDRCHDLEEAEFGPLDAEWDDDIDYEAAADIDEEAEAAELQRRADNFRAGHDREVRAIVERWGYSPRFLDEDTVSPPEA